MVSLFSVLAKHDDGIRLIHDGSQPVGKSMNDYATLETHYRFETVDNATSLMCSGYYMAKVDLKSAYQSVSNSKYGQQFTGLNWQFGTRTIYMKDTKLRFGSRLAPGFFHRLTQSVK